jgi:hypothetical protein
MTIRRESDYSSCAIFIVDDAVARRIMKMVVVCITMRSCRGHNQTAFVAPDGHKSFLAGSDSLMVNARVWIAVTVWIAVGVWIGVYVPTGVDVSVNLDIPIGIDVPVGVGTSVVVNVLTTVIPVVVTVSMMVFPPS